MRRIRFGTAGVPHCAEGNSSIAGIKAIHHLGMSAMELEFVQGVKMGLDMAYEVCQMAEQLDVRLSVHAPYYINLNSKEKEKFNASLKRIYNTARIGALCSARDIVFHPGFYQGEEPKKVYRRIRDALRMIVERLDEEKIYVTLRPELMGRLGQFGSLEEILDLCAEIPGTLPCIDFGHHYARTLGNCNSYNDFVQVFEKIKNILGNDALRHSHFHIEGIEYGLKGERRHRILQESDLRYEELMQAIVDIGIEGTAICESPNLERDALLLQRTYEKICNKKNSTLS